MLIHSVPTNFETVAVPETMFLGFRTSKEKMDNLLDHSVRQSRYFFSIREEKTKIILKYYFVYCYAIDLLPERGNDNK